MPYSKGRATSYSDFYKETNKTPENRGEEDPKTDRLNKPTPANKRANPVPPKKSYKGDPSWLRKAALKRRLQGFRKAG